MDRLKRRQDFVAVARAKYATMPGLVLQARNREDRNAPRAGFTATRRIGNAVIRNRAKRRLRELARLNLAKTARPGFDYVLIARSATLGRAFKDLESDLRAALERIHRPGDDNTDKK
jgi:ribonuclease P protein component